MAPTIPGRRRRAAVSVIAVALLVASCRSSGAGDEEVDLGLEPGEVRVVGEYLFGDRPRPGKLISMAVGPDGIIYFRLNTGTVARARSTSRLRSCCAQPDLAPGGVFVDDHAVYVTHGESTEPHRGVWSGPFAGGINVVVDLPEEWGQIPGDIAVDPNGHVVFTVRRLEGEGSYGIQVLRIDGDGGVEVVAGRGQGCTTQTTPAAEAQFSSLVGVAVGEDGVIYVADEACNAVYAVDDGSVRVVLSEDTAGPDGLSRPVDVAVIGGDVYVADRGLGDRLVDDSPDDGRVLRVDEGGATVVLDDAGVELDDPDDGRFNLRDVRSLAVTPDGDLLVLDDDRVIGIGVGRE
ncbi:MAG: hypothetical protein ACRD0A_06955 [Acidimicrobiales bacterium]